MSRCTASKEQSGERLHELLGGSIVPNLRRLAGDVDVHVVADRDKREHRVSDGRSRPVRASNGHYEIRVPFGKGGLAEVYRALEKTTGRDVAVKLPHVELVGVRARTGCRERRAGCDTQAMTRLLEHHIARVGSGQQALESSMVEAARELDLKLHRERVQ